MTRKLSQIENDKIGHMHDTTALVVPRGELWRVKWIFLKPGTIADPYTYDDNVQTELAILKDGASESYVLAKCYPAYTPDGVVIIYAPVQMYCNMDLEQKDQFQVAGEGGVLNFIYDRYLYVDQ